MTISADKAVTHLESGEIIPLLCAVADLTGDRELLDERFRPRLSAEMITVPADGGLDPDTAQSARERVAQSLRRYAASGGEGVGSPPSLGELIDFLTAGDREHAELMRHEFGDAEPTLWTGGTMSNGREFVVGIIGAGQAGLAMARELKRHGVNFVIFETASQVGGTWRWNAYPGCRLDTSTLAYSYSFAQKSDWRHYFAPRGALEAYFADVADREGILPRIQFGTTVHRATWNEHLARWDLLVEDVVTGAASVVTVNAVVSAVGILNRPNVPEFDGLEGYTGRTVHSAEWTDDIDVSGKRVAIIGTGASAYQIAPAIVDSVAELTVYQRNAPWMLPAPLYESEIDAGRAWLMTNIPSYHRWMRLWEFWHSTIGKYALTKADPDWNRWDSVSEPNKRFRDALVEQIREQYTGREDLIESVVPTYPVGAKRMLRDNGQWARTIRHEHTELVTAGLHSFDRTGIRTTDGTHRPADLVVFATGFHGTEFLSTVEIVGRGGQMLDELWGDEARAHKGIGIPGFPNLFCVSGPNTALVAIGSQTFMTECGVHYISECIRTILDAGVAALEPTTDAYRSYIDWVEEANRGMAWAAAAQLSWYRNSSGTNTVVWPFPLLTYYTITRTVNPDEVSLIPLPSREGRRETSLATSGGSGRA